MLNDTVQGVHLSSESPYPLEFLAFHKKSNTRSDILQGQALFKRVKQLLTKDNLTKI